jgi:tetratricopeptide (TPR) repeat protein
MKDKIAIGLLVILLLVNAIYFINHVTEPPAEIKKAQAFINEGDKYLAQHQWQSAADAYAKAEKIFRDKKRISAAEDFAYIINQLEIIKILTLKKRTAPKAGKVPVKQAGTPAVGPELSQKAAALKKVINAKIVNIDAYFNLGNTYYSLGRYAEAEEAYKKVLAVKPNDFQAYNGIGNCQNALGKYPAAIESYQASLNLNSNNFNAYNNMGNTYRNMNKQEQALAAYQKALELKPDSADVYYNLGMTHDLLGESKQAVKMLSKAKQLYQGKNNTAGVRRTDQALKKR